MDEGEREETAGEEGVGMGAVHVRFTIWEERTLRAGDLREGDSIGDEKSGEDDYPVHKVFQGFQDCFKDLWHFHGFGDCFSEGRR